MQEMSILHALRWREEPMKQEIVQEEAEHVEKFAGMGCSQGW